LYTAHFAASPVNASRHLQKQCRG